MTRDEIAVQVRAIADRLAVVDVAVIELRRIVVHPASRGAGQGRALLRAGLVRAYDHHDNEDLADEGRLAVRPGEELVLPRQPVQTDTVKAGLQVRHNLLCAPADTRGR